MAEPLLATRGLTRHFGGLAAVNDVSITLERGRLHAVVGPNGAGKTTLINVLAGELDASSGRVTYEGEDITRESPDRRSRRGIGRSYQKTNIFGAFTAFENCRLAAQSRAPRALHLWSDATAHPPTREAAERALAAAGLEGRGGRIASALSHGEQRQLEIAMVLATQPKLLLLDEPLAGMSPSERTETVKLLKSIAVGRTMIVIDHDMDAIFELAARITVLQEGRVLVEGTPEEIRNDARVQEAYLGGMDGELAA